MDITLITDWLLKIGYWLLQIGGCWFIGAFLGGSVGTFLGGTLYSSIFGDDTKDLIILGVNVSLGASLLMPLGIFFLLRYTHYNSFEYLLTGMVSLFYFCGVVKNVFIKNLKKLDVGSLFNTEYFYSPKLFQALEKNPFRDKILSTVKLTIYDALIKVNEAQQRGQLDEKGAYIPEDDEDWSKPPISNSLGDEI
jgi:hypothetical protein